MNPWAEEAQDRTFEKLREETGTERMSIAGLATETYKTYTMPEKTASDCSSSLREELIDVCVRYDVSAKVMKAILNAAGFDI